MDENEEEAPNHLIWEERPDGMTHFSCRATAGCLLTILVIFGIIILLIVLRHT
jgi:hypothetical protein